MPHSLSDTQFIALVQQSKSLADVIRGLGLLVAGANYETVKKRIARLDLDLSHFTGAAWNKENWTGQARSRMSLKAQLIRERGHKCQSCNNEAWLGDPITLELEHIDGNTRNNADSNLLLLCPNCHSKTPTWRRRKGAKVTPASHICPNCGGKKYYKASLCRMCFDQSRHKLPLKNSQEEATQDLKDLPTFNVCDECGKNKKETSAKRCTVCYHKSSEKVTWLPDDLLIAELRLTSYVQVAKDLGVSDTAIRHRLRARGYDPKTLESVKTDGN